MIVTPSSSIPGHGVVSAAGLVQGSTVRAGHLGKDLIAGLKNLAGKELEDYSDMMAQAHEQALDRMIKKAESLGANAILEVRVSTACVMDSVIEVLVYGNAVVLDSDKGDPNPGNCSPS
jgi:uncharacterized protein YbjQ (UPF0145 family)